MTEEHSAAANFAMEGSPVILATSPFQNCRGLVDVHDENPLDRGIIARHNLLSSRDLAQDKIIAAKL
jgi:hypothetical protein